MKKIILILLSLIIFSSPLLVLADNPLELDIPGIEGKEGLYKAVANIARAMFILLMLLTVIFVLYSSYLFLMAGGDADSIKKAKNILIYAAVAVVVALFAGGFAAIITNLVLDEEIELESTDDRLLVDIDI